MTGILPLARQLGTILECKPMETLLPIDTLPYRLRRGRWSDEQWAEIERINAEFDAIEARLDEGRG